MHKYGDNMKIKDISSNSTGISQYRIKESTSQEAQVYRLYGQNELYEDLYLSMMTNSGESKEIRSIEALEVLEAGNLIFSTLSGEATIVSEGHAGYLFTQNYVRMEVAREQVDARYMAFLLNESPFIQKQFRQQLQGSQVVRYSLNVLNHLILPSLPSLDIQAAIGNLYYNQLHLRLLKQKVADNEYTLRMNLLKGVNGHEIC